SSTQLLTIGETMALVTPTTPTALQTAEVFAVDAAGAESNVASHCAHLGISAAWVSALGDDPLGRRILADIAGRGVDTSRVQFDPHAPTGVYFKDPGAEVHYYRAGSAASRMGPALLRNAAIESAQLLHLTGITPALSASCTHLVDAAIDIAHAAQVPISFDINYRAALWPLDTAAPVLLALGRRADTVFVGLDEAPTLWRSRTPGAVRALFARPLGPPVHRPRRAAPPAALPHSRRRPPAVPARAARCQERGDRRDGVLRGGAHLRPRPRRRRRGAGRRGRCLRRRLPHRSPARRGPRRPAAGRA